VFGDQYLHTLFGKQINICIMLKGFQEIHSFLCVLVNEWQIKIDIVHWSIASFLLIKQVIRYLALMSPTLKTHACIFSNSLSSVNQLIIWDWPLRIWSEVVTYLKTTIKVFSYASEIDFDCIDHWVDNSISTMHEWVIFDLLEDNLCHTQVHHCLSRLISLEHLFAPVSLRPLLSKTVIKSGFSLQILYDWYL